MAKAVRYQGAVRKALARAIAKHGLTGTAALTRKAGIQVVPGQSRRKFKVSLPTLCKIGQEAGITLKRGRPRKAA